MVKDSMDLLELLRKRGLDGDVDFLREALRVLMDAIMDAEVSTRIGAEHGAQSRSAYSPQRVPLPHVGYQGRHDGASHTEPGKGATSRVFLSRGVDAGGDTAGVRGCVDEARGRSGEGAGL